jgi:uncharacterized membrane protein
MPKSRIEAFSDGVFAIVITLLVLEIKVPSLKPPISDTALVAALLKELPVIFSCVISFAIIAVIWVAHHQFWHSLRQADWTLLWLNNLLLLFVVFIPIPTWMIGAYPSLHTPAVIYGGVMTGCGLAFVALRGYASWGALMDLSAAEKRRALIRSALSPLLNLTGALVALWEPLWSFAFYVAVPIFYFVHPPSGRRATDPPAGSAGPVRR